MPPPGPEDAPKHAAAPVITPVKDSRIKSSPRTPQLASLLRGSAKGETITTNVAEIVEDEPYTEAQLREAWEAFAETRKKFQAEYQMLSQPYDLEGSLIVVQLLSPVHDTMLNSIKSELTASLREKLRNNTIQVTGKILTSDDKKVIYTNREKFDFLVEKNPMLKELKDRLGLDTDF